MINPANFKNIPNELRARKNFVVWRYETRDGEKTKVPYDAKSNGNHIHAKSNDPATWASFEEAARVADILSGNDYDGVGFMLQGTNIVGVDFDGVIDEAGTADPYVLSIIAQLGNPYTEITPSGTGMRCFVECDKLPTGKRKFSDGNHYGIEIYIGTEGGRYLTLTGNKFGGDGVPKVADLEIPYFLISQFRNIKLKKLWMGDASDFANDQSRADLALCDELVKLLGKDKDKILRYVRASKLYDEKWDRPDYIELTIGKALSVKSANGDAPSTELKFHLPAVITGSAYDFVINPINGESDGWFPLGSPSLVGGLSGANKTTLMVDLLQHQRYGEPFLGHTTQPRPYLILMVDRGKDSHTRTMRRMRLAEADIPIKFLSSQVGMIALQEIVDRIEETNPLPQIVFIEGADMLVEDGNKKQFVVPFMTGLQKVATHYHVAIIGSVGAPKSKPGEGYIAKRDNISGTEAWARLAETVAILQFPKGKDTAKERELSVLPRNAPAESFAMIFDNGRLRIQTEADHKRAEVADKAVLWAQAQARLAKTDPNKKWWTVLDVEQALDMATSTVYRWAQTAHAKNWITEKPGKKGRSKAALFCWNESKTNPLLEDKNEDELKLDSDSSQTCDF